MESSLIKNFIKRTNWYILLFSLAFSLFGLVLLRGIVMSGFANTRVIKVQIIAICLGIFCALVISIIDYHVLAKLWKFYLPIAILLVIATYFIGLKREGYEYIDDQAWLSIPFTNLTFQPSELLKIAFIITFALHLSKAREYINNIGVLFLLCLHGACITLLIVFQGDDGTAVVFFFIFLIMIFVAGIEKKYLISAISLIATLIPVFWLLIFDDDKRLRFLTIFNPALDPTGKGWQQNLSIRAIGSGQLMGKGLLKDGAQYVPEMYNDFIFSYIGESVGFIGSLIIMFAIFLFCCSLLYIGYKAKDDLGKYICIGVFANISFQFLWGLGMSLSLLPVAGLTTPFLSSGGTSVVTTYCIIGLVLSVYRYSSTSIFDK